MTEEKFFKANYLYNSIKQIEESIERIERIENPELVISKDKHDSSIIRMESECMPVDSKKYLQDYILKAKERITELQKEFDEL